MTSYIDIPDKNDSMSRITLSGREYFIRFTYNVRHEFWCFSLYNTNQELLLGMVRVVPLSPITEYYTYTDLPDGKFGCEAQGDIDRYAFKEKTARFFFIPNSDLEGWNPNG